jgi:hypothetical protein
MVETELFSCAPERKPAMPASDAVQDTFASSVGSEGLQNCGHFSRFSTRSRRISLQPRLSGGESGIRIRLQAANKAFNRSTVGNLRLCKSMVNRELISEIIFNIRGRSELTTRLERVSCRLRIVGAEGTKHNLNSARDTEFPRPPLSFRYPY